MTKIFSKPSKAAPMAICSKNWSPRSCTRCFGGVFEGEAPISRFTASKILNEFALQARRKSTTELEEELSAREKEVLQFLAGGHTNKEIGNKMGIAENTVKNHLKSILAKLHLENRVQAATFALQKGSVRQTDPTE